MEQKICTSIKQSKELLRLGLSPETADMYWKTTVKVLIASPFIDLFCNGDKALPCVDATPAWSLSAILDLMPYKIELSDESPTYILDISKDGGGYSMNYMNCMNGDLAALYTGSKLLDVVVEMVKWLLKNDYIKTKKK